MQVSGNGFQAVLWDMDGTLADTKQLHFHTWREAGARLGLDVSYAMFERTFGQNAITAARMMAEGTRTDIELFVRRKEELFREMAAEEVVLLPGVKRWLERFSALGLKQAIASSGPPANIQTVVVALDVKRYFQALVSGEGRLSKPNPATFLMAARQLGVEPEACLVIEDAPVGVSAAGRAGMRCIATATTNPRAKLIEADLVVATLEELSDEVLMRL